MHNEASRALNCEGVLFRTSQQGRAKGNKVRRKKRPAVPLYTPKSAVLLKNISGFPRTFRPAPTAIWTVSEKAFFVT